MIPNFVPGLTLISKNGSQFYAIGLTKSLQVWGVRVSDYVLYRHEYHDLIRANGLKETDYVMSRVSRDVTPAQAKRCCAKIAKAQDHT